MDDTQKRKLKAWTEEIPNTTEGYDEKEYKLTLEDGTIIDFRIIGGTGDYMFSFEYEGVKYEDVIFPVLAYMMTFGISNAQSLQLFRGNNLEELVEIVKIIREEEEA